MFLNFFGRHASPGTSPHSKNVFKTASFIALFALNRQNGIQFDDLIHRVMSCTSDCTGVWLRCDALPGFRQIPHGISRKNSRKIFRSAKSLGSFADGKRERARIRCQSANCGGKKTSKIALNEDYQALYLGHGTHENRFY